MTPATFPAELQQLDGEFLVRFPDVPEAITGATSREEALALAPDALAAALEGYLDAGRPIPSPSATRPGQEAITVARDVAARIDRAA